MLLLHSSAKAQSAIEYLMTYGWMLLVVAIVGGAVFSMVGDQNIESVTGFEGQSLQISDFGLTPVGLSISAKNRGANDITIKEIRLDEGDQNRSIPLNEKLSPRENRVVNIPGVKATSESNRLDVEFITDTGSLENITIKGSINGGLSIDKDIQGYWTLSEVHSTESGVLDLSGNQNNAEIVGDLSWSQTKLGNKPNFSESNYLQAESQEFLDIEDDITLSSWVEVTSKDDSSQDYILDYRGSTGNGYYLMHGTSSPDQDFQFRYYDSRLYSGISPNVGEIYHVLGRYEGGQMEIYVNGSLIDTMSADPDGDISADMFTIGNSYRETQNFEGIISDVRVYDRALSDEAVQFLFRNPGIIN